MTTTETATLPVPGARLHFEVRGSGPLLLLICGGVYDAGGYDELAEQLADHFTVVAYDRRGNSRSVLDGPPAPQRIAVHADDAHRLLEAVGAGEPAFVFGNSSGATIGVELAIRHPEQVRAVVAHEPPLFELLDDRERWRRLLDDVDGALANPDAGPGAALGILGAGLQEGREVHTADDVPRADAPDDAAAVALAARIAANMGHFITYEVPPFSRHVPDLDALRATGVRVIGAAGEASRGEAPHRAGVALATALGEEPLLLPGDHGGFGGPATPAFAARLREVLADV